MVDPFVALVARHDGVAIAEILGIEDHAVLQAVSRIDLDLYLDIRIDADV
jgi:hypothetical protein